MKRPFEKDFDMTRMPDGATGLVERLRAAAHNRHVQFTWPCVGEAADAIEALWDYAGHKRGCDMMSAFTDGKECTCGFAALAQNAK